jgi:hypothetical protein
MKSLDTRWHCRGEDNIKMVTAAENLAVSMTLQNQFWLFWRQAAGARLRHDLPQAVPPTKTYLDMMRSVFNSNS